MLKNNNGIHFFTEDDKVNTLHAKRIGKLNTLDIDVLLSVTTRVNQYNTNRKKRELEQQEQKEIQEEEMLVQSLLTEK